MSLDNYLERDVFERLYHTSTKASRGQRFSGDLPETDADRNPFMTGSFKASMKIFNDDYFTPSRHECKIPRPTSFRSPVSVMASRTAPAVSSPDSSIPSSPQIPSPPRRTTRPTASRTVKWSPKKSSPPKRSPNTRPDPRKLALEENPSKLDRPSPSPKPQTTRAAKKAVIASAPSPRAATDSSILSTEQAAALTQHLSSDKPLSLTEISRHMQQQYPALARNADLILAAFEKYCSDKSVAETAIPALFLHFWAYWSQLWDEFVFLDESDLRISKGEYQAVQASLPFATLTFDKLQTSEGEVHFEHLCAECALQTLHASEGTGCEVATSNSGSATEADLPSETELLTIFTAIDVNRSGKLSLQELDQYIAQHKPEWHNKSAILRAYRMADRDKDGFVLKSEFPYFYRFLAVYTKYWDVSAEESGDLRLSIADFAAVSSQISGMDHVDRAFYDLDVNNQGYVLFEEFCEYCARRELSDLASEKQVGQVLDASYENPNSVMLKKQDDLEEIELPCNSELFRIFDSIDSKGTGKLSLSELDSFVSKERPALYRKSAIMRAYHMADRDKDGFVMRSEFPFFYQYLQLYNQIWDAFDNGQGMDSGHHITKQEFVAASGQFGDVGDLDEAFEEIDIHRGGYILFDEFCAFCTKQKLIVSSLENEARKESITTQEDTQNTALLAVFDEIDANGVGILSHAELGRFIEANRPDLYRKAAIMRAHRLADKDDDGYVDRADFHVFMKFLEHYSRIWNALTSLDKKGDHRISKTDFALAVQQIDNSTDSEEAFSEINPGNSDSISYDELCAFFARKKLDLTLLDVNAKSGWNGKRKSKLPDENFLETFDSIDIYGRKMLSREEVGRYIMENRPEWNKKSSIARAFKAADRDHDGFLWRSEFGFFCRLISSYTKFWDPNRRVTKRDFSSVAWKLGVKDIDVAFAKLDTEGRGYILFDKFAEYKEKQKQSSISGKKVARSGSFDSVDSEATFPMDHYDRNLEETISEVHDALSVDENEMVSVATLHDYIAKHRPEWKNEAALVHAIRAADLDYCSESETGNDQLLPFDQIPFVLYFIFYYQSFCAKYTTLDGLGQRRVSKRQIGRAARHLRLAQVDETFITLDTHGSGHILFDSLCTFCANQKVGASA